MRRAWILLVLMLLLFTAPRAARATKPCQRPVIHIHKARGELILTCGSPQSRNMSLGIALGQGKSLDDILGARNSVSEGVYTASAVAEIALEHGLDLPICAGVDAVVSGRVTVDQAIEGLLARPFRAER